MTAVVVETPSGKVYRAPTPDEIAAATVPVTELDRVFSKLPHGMPNEFINTGSIRKGGVSITRWGISSWRDMFLDRQILALGVLVSRVREALSLGSASYVEREWPEAILAYLALVLDRAANYLSKNCVWESVAGEVKQTFLRFALPITWDFAESNPLAPVERCFVGALAGVASALEGVMRAGEGRPAATVLRRSVIGVSGDADIIITDPPYYDAIPYADLMDFFQVWLRRTLSDTSEGYEPVTRLVATPKWNHEQNDGELVDDESRFGGDSKKSKQAYEDGMSRALSSCRASLRPDGRLVIVFANKEPDAWEALVSAIIRAGFAVDGSWPIATEMRGGVRNAGRASLDFVWAATGPALEAYSKHPVVKKANEPNQAMTVSEFLRHVRRIVVDFVVGRVLTREAAEDTATGLDDVTTYYLLHRHDFGLGEAPAGACILYAVSCNLSDRDLSDRHDLLTRTSGKAPAEPEEEEAGEESSEHDEDDASGATGGSGNKLKLKAWDQRKAKSLGDDVEGKPAPLVDKVHRLMHLWRSQDQAKVNEYIDTHALWKNPMFHQLLQALVELAGEGTGERALLESLSNHVGVPGRTAPTRQIDLPMAADA